MANSTDRRTIILQATLDLVAEHGLLNTTISLIAKQAASSPGIIYHYFASKDDIVHSLYEVVLKQYTQAMMQANPLALDRFEWFKQLWLTTFHYFVDHPKHASFLEQYKNSTYGQHKQSIESDENLSLLVQVIQEDINQGLIKDRPFDVIYTLTIGVAISLAKLQIAGIIQLDEAMLAEIAEASCRTLQA
jgi:TetR/AcrR family transcriptional regulator, repressor of fatR-cypB operon